MTESNGTTPTHSAHEILNRLKALEDEAIISGAKYRPEHRGYDLAIGFAQILPLIEEAESLPDYQQNDSFRRAIDEYERRLKLRR